MANISVEELRELLDEDLITQEDYDRLLEEKSAKRFMLKDFENISKFTIPKRWQNKLSGLAALLAAAQKRRYPNYPPPGTFTSYGAQRSPVDMGSVPSRFPQQWPNTLPPGLEPQFGIHADEPVRKTRISPTEIMAQSYGPSVPMKEWDMPPSQSSFLPADTRRPLSPHLSRGGIMSLRRKY